MAGFFKYPSSAGGVPIYATSSAFPATATDGTVVIAADTGILYEYNTGAGAWRVIGGPGVALSIGTANGLSITANALSLALSSTSTVGALSAADWNTFNNKQPSGNYLVNPLTTLGDIVYEDGTPVPARLAGNTATTQKFLSQTGTGTVSAAPTWTAFKAPTMQLFAASGTYTRPTPAPLYIEVIVVAGGGGGGGSGSAGATDGNTGGDSSFGAIVTAGGGDFGTAGTSTIRGAGGAAGNSPVITAPAYGYIGQGNAGGYGQTNQSFSANTSSLPGGEGGIGYLGGGAGNQGQAGYAGTGSGGAGGYAVGAASHPGTGGGGQSGGWAVATIPSPAASYAVVVGVGGPGGGAGTAGNVGGDGADGSVIIREYYQ